jgi:virginiamycin B lyase
MKLLFCHCSVTLLLCSTILAQSNKKAPSGLTTPGIQSSMASVKPLATFEVPGAPDWMAVTDSSVWVTSSPKNTVTQLDAKSNAVGHVVTVAKPCAGLVFAFGSIWSPSCGDRALVRFNATTGIVQQKIAAGPVDSEGGIAAGDGSVWMLISDSSILARIDAKTNKIEKRITVPAGSVACTFGAGAVWVTSPAKSVVARVDPATNTVTDTIETGSKPRFLTFGGGAVWTLNQGDGTISRIDASTRKLVATIKAGLEGEGGEITFGEGALWTTLIGFPITKIDSKSNHVMRQWSGPGGDSIRIGLGSLWLTDYKGGKVWRIDPKSL